MIFDKLLLDRKTIRGGHMGEDTIPEPVKSRLKRLRVFNVAVGLVLLAQGILMFFLSNDYSLPVTTQYLGNGTGRSFPIPVDRQAGSLRLGPMVALFLLLSGIALLLIAAPRINDWYNRNLLKGANYGRWIEYSITASLMIVVIAMLSGIYDLSTLILLFFMNAMMILFGWMMELHNQTTEKTDWTAFYFGCIAGAVPWVIIWLYFISAASDPTSKVPGFVYGIMVSLFIFFNIFAVNMVLQYKKVGPWKDYLFGEKVYIILSLTAKSLLAWQVFFGTLR
jgi:Heliorhodopsin